jgi:TolB protein
MTRDKTLYRLLLIAMCLLARPAGAVIDITITQGVEQALPIAIVPFAWTGQPGTEPLDFHVTISNNLSRSGRFRPMNDTDLPQRPSRLEDVNFKDWRLLGMDNIVIGNLVQNADGNYTVEFRLLSVLTGRQVAGFRVTSAPRQLRRTAHRISDIIFEKLIGMRGAFDTRIAYVTVQKTGKAKKYTLQIADADGFNPQILLESPEPLMSPAWSPDGRKLAYVSFEGRNSTIYVQDIGTGARDKVASNPGINSAPAWSPDGTRLALTLSKDGDPEIFVMHLAGRTLQRLTNDRSIDTEPAWSPDGTRIAFTSDRGGGPQVYEMSAQGGSARRVTFDGPYNARPRYSPDGKSLAVVTGRDRVYRIGVVDLKSGYLDILSKSRLDESPSFAPNGGMIIYTATVAGGTELAAVSVDGRVHQRLALQEGEVREPAWGPFLSTP